MIRLTKRFKRHLPHFKGSSLKVFPYHIHRPTFYILLTTILTLLATFFLLTTLNSTPHAPRLRKGSGNVLFTASNKVFSADIGKKDGSPTVAFQVESAVATFTLAGINSAEAAKQTRNQVVYEDILDNTDLVYTTLSNGVKEELVIKAPPSDNSAVVSTYLFDLDLAGTTPKELTKRPDGVISLSPTFEDSEGNYLFHFEKPFAVDSAGNRTNDVLMQIGEDRSIPGKYYMRLSLDPAWLSDPARVYPVTIDPTIVHDTSTEFSAGTLNRVKDTGTGSVPSLETWYQELPADEHTVGLWHMNEGTDNTCTGGEDICDASGNGNDGTFNGNAAFTGSGKLGGDSTTYDGTGDYISTSMQISPAQYVELTMEAWLKPSGNAAAYGSVLAGDDGGYDRGFGITNASTNNYLIQVGDGTWSPGLTIDTSKWHHVALVYSSSDIKFYYDGKEHSYGSAGNFGTSTQALEIGKDTACGVGCVYEGLIDEVRISNIARTPEEIKAAASRRPYSVYTSDVIDLTDDVTSWTSFSWDEWGVATGDGETLYDDTSLVAQWNFNETSGTTADNAEGTAALDGTLSGFDSTASQDADPDSSWTANNRRWGAGALQFDGVDSYVDTGSDASLKFANTDNFTLSSWIYTSPDSSDDVIMGNSWSSKGYHLRITSTNKLRFVVLSSGTNYAFSDSISTLSPGWHYVVGVWNGTDPTTYVDGKLSSVAGTGGTLADFTAITNFSIGNATGDSKYFKGTIDSTRIYSRALPAHEIMSNYNSANIEFQTRVGADTSPDDGSWDAWLSVTGETAIASMDSDASNWSLLPLPTSQRSCKEILDNGLSTGDGIYTIDLDGQSYSVYCDMTTNGGGWTLVANIAPADGNSVGYNNQSFWTAQSEYGSFANKFANDYKSPAAYQLKGDQLMIQSVNTGASGSILGWRSWPMTSKRTFNSFFTTGIEAVHATDYCETGDPDNVSVGTTNTWDDIIRQGTCLYSNVNPSASGEGDNIRLTTLPYNSLDNRMSGFASCIDCGTTWQGTTSPYQGIDRAGCNSSSCTYATICRVPSADCLGAYCTNPTYATTSCGSTWNSRFYVRDNSLSTLSRSNESNIKSEGTGSLKVLNDVLQDTSEIDDHTVALWHLDETGGTGAYLKSAAGNPPTYATGGTIATSSGYTTHTFTSGGTFTPGSTGKIEVLVVGGGGGGSSYVGGGGGGGGFVEDSTNVSASAYTVTVGAGGSGGSGAGAADNTNGSNSSVSGSGVAITAIGGGTGGRFPDVVGAAGGSGGGTGGCSAGGGTGGIAQQPISSSGGYGYRGGNMPDTRPGTETDGRGGGGAGAAGGDTSCLEPGDAGIGRQSSISGTSYYYGGGGGGGGFYPGTSGTTRAGNGGSGGGGGGGAYANGTVGTGGTGGTANGADGSAAGQGIGGAGGANTGGGGGGAGHSDKGGNGGSGVVIIRYGTPDATPTGTTLTQGISGKGRSFNGSSDYIDTGSMFPSLTNNFSISFWVKPGSSQNAYADIFGNHGGTYTGMAMQQDNTTTNKYYFFWGDGAAWQGWHSTYPYLTLSSDKWQHVAITKTSTGGTNLYQDGVFIANSSSNAAMVPSTTMNVRIGMGWTDGTGRNFSGEVDEFKIDNVERTAEEIAESYRMGRDHYLNKTISSTDLSGKSSLPFYIAADRPGTYLDATVGESAYANYQPDSNTIGLWHLDEETETARTCYSLRLAGATSDGVYTIDPDGPGGNAAFQAYCNMTYDGGGWTMAVKSWYGSGMIGNTGAVGAVTDATTRKGNAYKLSDANILNVIGSSNNFDVMGDQSGYNSAYSTGNYEYVVLRNYTGTWTYASAMAASSTTTSMQSYRISDQALAWSGNMTCGYAGGAGINCYTLSVGNPQGGAGCIVNMGTASNTGWHHFFMNNTNDDTYIYMCNGPQHSSSFDMNHRWWIRERNPIPVIKDRDATDNHNDATNLGATSTQGVLGKARSFNGSSDYIDLGSTFSTLTNDLSISFWAKPGSSQVAYADIFGNHGGTYTGMSFQQDNTTTNKYYFLWGQGSAWIGWQAAYPYFTLNADEWQHIAITKSSTGGANLYQNGTLIANIADNTAVTPHASYTVKIGNGWADGWRYFNGSVDEFRIDNTVRSASEIRQAYEVGLRTHPITIDFAASLDSGNLITGSGDLSFTVDATAYGLNAKGSALYKGDKIIVRENYDGTEYIAQGTVTAVTESTGAVTVAAWDSGSTFHGSGYTANASVFKWQREYWPVADNTLSTHMDAITNLTLRLTNGSEGRTVWLDDLKSNSAYLTTPGGSTITSSTGNRYMQYRAIMTSLDEAVSATLSAVTLDYVSNTAPSTPSLDLPTDTATNQSVLPVLKTTTTDADSDYIRYKIELCEDVGMSVSCQTFDQTSSQTGWSGQDAQTSTAYASGTQATYTLQSALAVNDTFYWRSYAIDPGGTNTWSSTQGTPYSFSTTTAPTAPTVPYTEGSTNPANVIDLTPEFSAVHNDGDGDSANYYQIEVNTASNFAGTVMWDSTKTSMTTTANGVRSPDISYAGSALSLDDSVYYWRIKFWDTNGAEGVVSATQNFGMNIKPTTPSLDLPTDTATNQSLLPVMKTTTTDADSDYLRYKVQICTDLAMTTGCNTYDQTSSQTGWSGQDAQTSTAYASGTQATYTLQSVLATSTTYYWRSYAIDPAGANAWSATQTPYSFTTLDAPSKQSDCRIQEASDDSQNTIIWTDVATNEDYYQVDRSKDAAAWSTLSSTIAANSTSYVDSTITTGATYYYRVAPYLTVGPTYGDWCYTNTLTQNLGTFRFD